MLSSPTFVKTSYLTTALLPCRTQRDFSAPILRAARHRRIRSYGTSAAQAARLDPRYIYAGSGKSL